MSLKNKDGDVLGMVTNGLVETASEVVPWFFGNMHDYYFRTHSEQEQVSHLKALISGQAASLGQTLVLRNPDRNVVTFISPGSGDVSGAGPEGLFGSLAQLSGEEIKNARLYSSRDGKMRLDTYVLAPQEQADRTCARFAQAMDEVRADHGLEGDEVKQFEDFLASATSDCVDKFEAARAIRHFRVHQRLGDRARVLVHLDQEPYPGLSRVMVAMNNPRPKGWLLDMVRVLDRAGLEISRAYADIYQAATGPFAVASFYVHLDGKPLDESSAAWLKLKAELVRSKWRAPHELEALADENGWTLDEVDFIQAACEFAHQFLLMSDLHAYTSHNVVHAVLRHRKAARSVLAYFRTRFEPDVKNREKAMEDALGVLQSRIADLPTDLDRNVFSCMEAFVGHTLRTNHYMPHRFGLSFRMDPDVLDHVPGLKAEEHSGENRPFGFFFFHGPYFLGFHVRYRDMARGGVRLVPTRTQEQFELESNRLFHEVTALARSQQSKNKDIPEGGSKAVLLLGPGAEPDMAVKSMSDSMLDIIVAPDGAVCLPGLVEYLGREEIIYLGPDEHIQHRHIDWIVERAKERGFRYSSAFMSSKPLTGINHKQYGVTSLGVVVFAEEVLKYMGIDPDKQRFTVKITGGPRGDVAGNAIRFLDRDYGDNAVIVGVSDGHGSAWDPDGLDHGELMRLVDAELGIAEFDPKFLRGKGAYVAASDTPEGARLRDSMHNTAPADMFIPAGGRPDTINADNWRDFLDAEGKPTARAIVEGANIFLSQEARDRLEEKGVIIIHGASANKTGVICSSYEILAGLALDDDEFLAIKDEYVAQVQEILKTRARDEARLLLREYRLCGRCEPLTHLSLRLSKEINTLSDRIALVLGEENPDIGADPDLRNLLLSYCPAVFADNYAERILSEVPKGHQHALLAAYAASRVVYAEGSGWFSRLVEYGDPGRALKAYLAQERRVAELIEAVDGCEMSGREELHRILEREGLKRLTADALGLD